MGVFCERCGRPLDQGGHDACARRQLDPPRFCATCGFRLDVQVYPHHVVTACRECRRRRARGTAPPERP